MFDSCNSVMVRDGATSVEETAYDQCKAISYGRSTSICNIKSHWMQVMRFSFNRISYKVAHWTERSSTGSLIGGVRDSQMAR